MSKKKPTISNPTQPQKSEPKFSVVEPIKYHSFAEYVVDFPDRDERYRIECTVPEDGWVQLPSEHRTKFTSPEELYAIIQGKIICPICDGCGRYDITERGNTPLTQNILRVGRPFCKCMGWEYVVSVANKEMMAPLYNYVDLWTLQPSLQSILPRALQEEELKCVRENRNGSFLILGPSGTGKSTISCALMKYAHERDFKCFWEDGSKKQPYDKTRWIWRANFDLLLQQYNAFNTATREDKKEPYVTVDKINAAREAGHTPFLIIEEVDKTKLNEHRVKFLFQLIDAMINNNGQLILTSNLPFGEFVDALSREEEMETSQETITRRLIQRVHVRDYFRMQEKKPEVISLTK